jgi:hypothetical protein
MPKHPFVRSAGLMFCANWDGGCGITYRARDPALKRVLAVKVLRPEMLLSGRAEAVDLRGTRSRLARPPEHPDRPQLRRRSETEDGQQHLYGEMR